MTMTIHHLDNQIKHKIVREAWSKHQFHLMDSSPLPILTAYSIFLAVQFLIWVFHFGFSAKLYHSLETNDWGLFLNLKLHQYVMLGSFCLMLFLWFSQVVREASAGDHTPVVQRGLRLGMVLFIVSEIFFFFALFWAFFHFSSAPSVMLGCTWPPESIQRIDPWGLPFLNTVLLLSSGVAITIAHHALLNADLPQERRKYIKFLTLTVLFGVAFLVCQWTEYTTGVAFSWRDNVYGSIFFTTTAFHGFHVTFGTAFLLFCLLRDAWFPGAPLKQNYGLKFAISYLFFAKKRRNPRQLFKKCLNWRYYTTSIIINNRSVRVIKILITALHFLLPRDLTKKYFEYACRNDRTALKDFLKRGQILVAQSRIYCWDYASSPSQHLGFEAAAWYWHFVDVVWLFLFVTIYCWGN